MTSETVTGLVLSSGNIGEIDRRIVLLTREKGKISAFARGAVKPRNPLVSATQAFTFGDFLLYTGKDYYTVTGAEIKKHFAGLTKDIEKYYYAAYLCEIAAFYTRENLNAENELLLLYQSLKALDDNKIPNELIRYIFEWRMLLISGEYPVVSKCKVCGNAEGLCGLDVRKHGLVCGKCGGDVIPLKNATIYTLKYIMTSPINTLFSFTLKEDILKEFAFITKEYLEKTQNYDFKSLDGIDGFAISNLCDILNS